MATYTVQYGQNLFDVALTLYGSIEGILDLLVNNKNLSINTELKYGDELEYTPYYYEDSTVVSYFKDNNIIPSNSIGNIYFETRDAIYIYLIIIIIHLSSPIPCKTYRILCFCQRINFIADIAVRIESQHQAHRAD